VIWNNAWKNQSLVQAHCLWEVHDGKSTLFWEDVWEQLPILGGGDHFLTLRNSLGRAGWEKLHHFWKTEPLSESTFMRTWKPLEEWSVQWMEDLKLSISRTLQERQIEIQTGEDIIRWGPQGNGEFRAQTTYQLLQDSGRQQNRPIWRKIWSSSLWPKVSTFLWLVAHKKILMWDQLLRKGYVDPSRCILCCENEETQDHILRNCSFTRQLWDLGAINFKDLQKYNVVANLREVERKPF
jgi:hypothetical protein